MSTTKYLAASLNGAKFLVEDTSDTLGARNIKHEFPGNRETLSEPTGLHTRTFEIRAHFIGKRGDTPFDNFETRLDALERVLLKPGPYTLVHPNRGKITVALDGPVRIQRTARELGIVRVSMQFYEAGIETGFVSPRDTSIAVKAYAKAVRSKTLPRGFDASGPDFLSQAVAALLAGPKALNSLTNKIGAMNNRVSGTLNVVTELSNSITNFSNAVLTLVNTPAALGLAIQGLSNSLMSAIKALGLDGADRGAGDQPRNRARVAAATAALSSLGGFGAGLTPVVGTTATRERERVNQNEMADVVEAAALADGIEALLDIPFDNTTQAGGVVDVVDAVIEGMMARGSVSDDALQSIRSLRASFHTHLRRALPDNAGLNTYAPPATMPAFLLAHQLYGDYTREAEIIERNGVEHPGFVPGGRPLYVSAA